MSRELIYSLSTPENNIYFYFFFPHHSTTSQNWTQMKMKKKVCRKKIWQWKIKSEKSERKKIKSLDWKNPHHPLPVDIGVGTTGEIGRFFKNSHWCEKGQLNENENENIFYHPAASSTWVLPRTPNVPAFVPVLKSSPADGENMKFCLLLVHFLICDSFSLPFFAHIFCICPCALVTCAVFYCARTITRKGGKKERENMKSLWLSSHPRRP